ncbi:hypothetical protein CEXT_235061 [Caerostris extrusa]|uniref:Uncharacterized protein n=1 Tax=Caerostris extrusa TaxID=172846 RepID=A0AAV4XPR4_CAEEX|nr:hypothetical protein CEXT_235061 [Caerostris extrusa]
MVISKRAGMLLAVQYKSATAKPSSLIMGEGYSVCPHPHIVAAGPGFPALSHKASGVIWSSPHTIPR